MPVLKNLYRLFNYILSAVILFFISFYKYCISPYLGRNCRFEPTCSAYSHQCIKNHGIFVGALLSIKRILKCNPWGGVGYDPVPKKKCKK